MSRLSRSKDALRVVLPQALTLVVSALPVVALLGVIPATARAGDVFQIANDDASSLFDKTKASVVQVQSGDKGFVNAGSGFFIDDHGTVLTSSTILGDNKTARVIINGVTMEAKVIGNDPRSGLAMLRAAYDESPALTFSQDALKTGDGVMMLGFPMSLPVTYSQGPVSGFDGSYLAQIAQGDDGKTVSAIERFATTHIHANTTISPGQVGGPLLNSHGEVVGLVATSPDSGRSVYALPVNAMLKIVADFNLYGRARHGWVGINVAPGPDTQHDGRTVRVVQVVPGTPASQSGILTGDTIMRIDSREIYRPEDVLDASFFTHVGGNMTVVIRRDDKLLDYTFAVIERPQPTPAPGSSVTSNAPGASDGQPLLVTGK